MSRNINMENNMQEVDATMNSAEKNNNVEAETMANISCFFQSCLFLGRLPPYCALWVGILPP